MDADANELRVLGCLIEKQRTTPDVYPLSLNAVRTAANQSTNRDPVMALDENQVRDALQRLNHRRWTRLASGARTGKYRHLMEEAFGLQPEQVALLAVLCLRGAQTLGELNARVARLHRFEDIDEVAGELTILAEKELVARLPRRPGEREERWEQRLGETGPEPAFAPVPVAYEPAPPPAAAPAADEERLQAIESELAELRAAVIELKAALGG